MKLAFAWCFIIFATISYAQQLTNSPAPKLISSNSVSPAPSNTPTAIEKTSQLGSLPQPSNSANAFSFDPTAFRSWFFDLVAAVFGILAVLFALLTVIVTVGGIISGISKYRDLIDTIEKDLKEKVNKEFGNRLDEVVEKEIKPKVQGIIAGELRTTLEGASQRIKDEISRTIEEADLKEALIQGVATEIQRRLTAAQPPKVESTEFGK